MSTRINEKKFHLNEDIDWEKIMAVVDEEYHRLVEKEYGKDSEIYKHTTATDFVYISPDCDEEPYQLRREEGFFGEVAEHLTHYLREKIPEYSTNKVPEIQIKSIFVRGVPSPYHHSCFKWMCNSNGVCVWVDMCAHPLH